MTGISIVIGTLLISVSTVANSDIYKWTDPDGAIHYTTIRPDTPHRQLPIEDCTSQSCLEAELERAEATIREVEAIEQWLDSRQKSRKSRRKKVDAINRSITFRQPGA